MHFYYFAVLAMLSGFCDWRVLALAAGLVSLHHLSSNFILPDAIYPGGDNPWRVSVHAVVVVIEVAMLIFIGHTIREAFATAAQARQRVKRRLPNSNVSAASATTTSLRPTSADVMGKLLETFKAEMAHSINVLNEAAFELEQSANSLGATADRAKT